MSWRSWLVAGAFTAWLAFIVVRSLIPWTWVGQYTTPANQTHSVAYRCGSIWGPGSVVGPTIPYPLTGKPCENRSDMQVVSVIDVAVGFAGIAGVVWWRRRRAAEPETAPL